MKREWGEERRTYTCVRMMRVECAYLDMCAPFNGRLPWGGP
jgi:hypothetical protein